MDLEQYLVKQREDAIDKIVASLVNSQENAIKKSLETIQKMTTLVNGESYDVTLKNIALDIIADCYNCDEPAEGFNLNESIFDQLSEYEGQLRPCCSVYTFKMDYFDKIENKNYNRTIQIPGFLSTSEFCYLIMALFGIKLGYSFRIETNFETLSPLDMLDEPRVIELFDFSDGCDFVVEGDEEKPQNTIVVKLIKNEFLNRTATLDDFKLLESAGGLISDANGNTPITDEQLIKLFSSEDSYVNLLVVKMYYEMPEVFFDLRNDKITVGEAIKKLYGFEAEENASEISHFLA